LALHNLTAPMALRGATSRVVRLCAGTRAPKRESKETSTGLCQHPPPAPTPAPPPTPLPPPPAPTPPAPQPTASCPVLYIDCGWQQGNCGDAKSTSWEECCSAPATHTPVVPNGSSKPVGSVISTPQRLPITTLAILLMGRFVGRRSDVHSAHVACGVCGCGCGLEAGSWRRKLLAASR
jgi:hypothetical protein